MAEVITGNNFDEIVLKSPVPVVVDMFATWCGPCKQMEPIFDQLSKDLDGKYKLVKINIDEDRELTAKYSVSSIPTFLFIKDGELIAKQSGSLSKETLLEKIKEHLG